MMLGTTNIKFNDIEVTDLLGCKPVLLGRGSSVGIAIRYGLYGSRIESRLGEIFRTCPDRILDR